MMIAATRKDFLRWGHMVEISHQPAVIQLGNESETASLLFAETQLLAVLVFLEPSKYENDPAIAGRWSVEVGFGRCQVGTRTVLFASLDAAKDWAAKCLQPG